VGYRISLTSGSAFSDSKAAKNSTQSDDDDDTLMNKSTMC